MVFISYKNILYIWSNYFATNKTMYDPSDNAAVSEKRHNISEGENEECNDEDIDDTKTTENMAEV